MFIFDFYWSTPTDSYSFYYLNRIPIAIQNPWTCSESTFSSIRQLPCLHLIYSPTVWNSSWLNHGRDDRRHQCAWIVRVCERLWKNDWRPDCLLSAALKWFYVVRLPRCSFVLRRFQDISVPHVFEKLNQPHAFFGAGRHSHILRLDDECRHGLLLSIHSRYWAFCNHVNVCQDKFTIWFISDVIEIWKFNQFLTLIVSVRYAFVDSGSDIF